ncbi:hypothetical protein L218DRAFT_962646 [Marasmius fiardii PR-910]|nr:hypothetical protein L218DRAFT_962646 [Marasmius fiardii PR-910]
MASSAFFAVLISAFAGAVSAAVIPQAQPSAVYSIPRQISFQELPYAQFQISDGTAGQAEAKAKAVCVDPFADQDLATVDSASLQALKNMRSAAENAETELFNPAIEAASGAEAEALQNGKIQNKVLKLICLGQVRNITLAQAQAEGEDTAKIETKLADTATKLTKNIATDVKNAGAPSKGVA